MATHWIILAITVTLALVPPEVVGVIKHKQIKETDEQRKMTLLTECCYANRMVSLDLKEADACGKSAGIDEKGSPPTEEKVCKLHECMLEKNGVLNEDKSVKEQEFKQIFLDKADPDAKPVVQAALDKCFNERKKNPKKAKGGKCKSGVNSLISCFTKEIYTHCPDKMWDHNTAKCQAAKDKGDEEQKRMSLLTECCYADRMVSLDLKDAETCSESAGLDVKDTPPTDEKVCEMHDCILGKNSMLNEDKSINETEFRKVFLDKADPDAKPVVQSALDKCFDELKKNPEKAKGGSCKSGVNFLIGCFTKEVYKNCPEKMWNSVSSKCQAARGDSEQKRMTLLAQCCDADRVVSLDFKEADSCSKSAGLDDKDSPPTDEKVCKMHECILEKNELLNEDKSIKDQEFKKLFIDKAAPESKPVVQAALDKCFNEFKKKSDHGNCKSGVNPLISCFTKEIYTNCPKNMWDNNNEKCKAAKGKGDSEHKQMTAEQKEMNLLTECCYADDVVALGLKDADTCSKSAGIDDKGSPPSDQKVCDMHECILEKNGLIKEDKSIKEDEFRKLFLDKADPDAKPAVQDALDKCFNELKQDSEKLKGSNCKSGVNTLIGCFTKDVYTNCPDKMWDKTKPKCQAARKKYDEQKRMSLLTECCYADKVVSLDLKNKKPCTEAVGGFSIKEVEPSDEKVCEMHECILNNNGLLNEDKSIKDQEFKKMFLDKADPDAKPVVQAALDQCFDELKSKKYKKTCKSGVNSLIGCFTQEVYGHCPDKMWDNTKSKCQAIKEKENEEKKMMLLTECCKADKEDKVGMTLDAKDVEACSKSVGLGGKKMLSDNKMCKISQCILEKKKLLNKDKSIKEDEFRKLLLDKSDPEAKGVVQAALDKCFVEHKKDHDQAKSQVKGSSCRSFLESLNDCLTKEVYTNCPDKLWDKDNPKCQGSKENLLKNFGNNNQQKENPEKAKQ